VSRCRSSEQAVHTVCKLKQACGKDEQAWFVGGPVRAPGQFRRLCREFPAVVLSGRARRYRSELRVRSKPAEHRNTSKDQASNALATLVINSYAILNPIDQMQAKESARRGHPRRWLKMNVSNRENSMRR
jgi:hypothetical protein